MISICKLRLLCSIFLIFNNLSCIGSSLMDIKTELTKISTPCIISSNIKLDFLHEFHAGELFDLTNKNRNHLVKWLPWVNSCKSIKDSQNFILKAIKDRESGKALVMGIWYNDSIVGVISYHKIDFDQLRGDIGYWLSEEAQGQGIITQSCKELMKIGFSKLNLKIISISCAPENIRSQGIPIRLNFKESKSTTTSNSDSSLQTNINYIFTYEDWIKLHKI